MDTTAIPSDAGASSSNPPTAPSTEALSRIEAELAELEAELAELEAADGGDA